VIRDSYTNLCCFVRKSTYPRSEDAVGSLVAFMAVWLTAAFYSLPSSRLQRPRKNDYTSKSLKMKALSLSETSVNRLRGITYQKKGVYR